MPDLLPAVWKALGGAADELDRIRVGGPPVVLRSVFPVRFVHRDRDATELVCLVADDRRAARAA